MIWFIIILLITVILFLFLKKTRFEGFENHFDIYVITLKREDRLKNIEKQQQKINIPIQLFDAVKGDNLDLNKIVNLKKDGHFYENEIQKKREIGCYLSHYNIYKKCKKTGYTIIFEDDFSIDVDNLIDKIDKSIQKLKNKNVDFDIMYIGNHKWNKKHGSLIIDDLYKIGNNEGLGGTHAYVINNKNIDKIIENTKVIDMAIDVKIQRLADEKKINVIKTYPYYVNTDDLTSTIVID
jgi:GR25 family glycosyltransferase involved in LPS biosynthesis